MKTTITRDDIQRHTVALDRIVRFEKWAESQMRQVLLKTFNGNDTLRVACGGVCGESVEEVFRTEEAIFERHINAAVEETLQLWKREADLE